MINVGTFKYATSDDTDEPMGHLALMDSCASTTACNNDLSHKRFYLLCTVSVLFTVVALGPETKKRIHVLSPVGYSIFFRIRGLGPSI